MKRSVPNSVVSSAAASERIRSLGVLTLRRSALIGAASAVLGFLLSVERARLPIEVQVLPPVGVLALVLMPFVLVRIPLTPLLKSIFLFSVMVLLQSAVALVIDTALMNLAPLRIALWARQVMALLTGVAIFMVLRFALSWVSDRQLIFGVLLGAIPSLILALGNVIWGVTGSEGAGALVTTVRDYVLGPDKGLFFRATSYRATGLSNEPSSFAFYLSAVLLPPALLGAISEKKGRKFFILISCWVLLALLWTFSITGFAVFLSILLAAALVGPRRMLFLGLLMGIAVTFAMAILVWIPTTESWDNKVNYVLYAWENLNPYDPRVYSTLGPLLTMVSGYAVLGYGLGGTSAHFSEIIPEEAHEALLESSWEGAPNLKTLFGRLVAETGLLGVTLMALIFVIAVKQIGRLSTGHKNRDLSLLSCAPWAIAGLIIGLGTGGIGSFASPYLWFWLAVIDSRYMAKRGTIVKL